MGCGSSNPVLKKIPADWLEQFHALCLTDRELAKLFVIFKNIDTDLKGSIDTRELMMYLDLEKTSFTERAFLVFDANGSHRIDFREFILSLWNYCTLTKATLHIFTFDLYDQDTSGELSLAEVMQMVEDLYGPGFQSNANARQVIQELKKLEKQGPFDLKRFSNFARSHQQLMFPAFQMQMRLQESIMGVKFWEKCTNRRVEWSRGKYATMEEIMEMHLNPVVFLRIAHRQPFSYSKKRTGLDAKRAVPALPFMATGTLYERATAAPEVFHVHEPPNDKNNKHIKNTHYLGSVSPSRRSNHSGSDRGTPTHKQRDSIKSARDSTARSHTSVEKEAEFPPMEDVILDTNVQPHHRAKPHLSNGNNKVGVVHEDLHITDYE